MSQKPFFRDKQGRVRYTGRPITSSKQLRFITKDGRVIPIGGPGAGSGTTSAGTIAPKQRLITSDTLTEQEFVNLRLWQDENLNTRDVPVYASVNDLPPVPPGHTRVFHGTHLQHVESIAENGLQFGSSAGHGEALPFIMGIANAPSGFGIVNVIVDVPTAKVNALNRSDAPWVEVYEAIPAHKIVGFLPTNISVTRDRIPRLLEIYREFDPDFGRRNTAP